MASNFDNTRSTRYTKGGTIEVLPNRLGWWERNILEKRDDDIEFVITNEYAHRPDLLAYYMYGNPTYAWLVLQYNNILDINEEFLAGDTIILPSPKRVMFSFS